MYGIITMPHQKYSKLIQEKVQLKEELRSMSGVTNSDQTKTLLAPSEKNQFAANGFQKQKSFAFLPLLSNQALSLLLSLTKERSMLHLQ
jgi:hypothetical protein